MEMTFTEWVRITDTSSVGEVRRVGQHAAERLGLDEVKSGELALLATEVSRNMLIHGGGGEAIILGTKDRSGPSVVVLALDSGPGIANVAQALQDGYSTAGTMGGGLGAIKRMAHSFEIFTGPHGTIVLIQVGQPLRDPHLHVAGIAIPYPGERFCGDAWAQYRAPDRMLAVLVDGLGHGWDAHVAAQEAISVFHKRSDLPPREILQYMHEALRKTRGAVGAVAEIRPADKYLSYAGVGNAVAVLLTKGTSKNLVSHNGTLGVATPRIQEFRADWPADGILVMHSDGVQTRWDLSTYAGLLVRHPAVIGGTLIRDFRRKRDDASVLVVKAVA